MIMFNIDQCLILLSLSLPHLVVEIGVKRT